MQFDAWQQLEEAGMQVGDRQLGRIRHGCDHSDDLLWKRDRPNRTVRLQKPNRPGNEPGRIKRDVRRLG
jgi:hypothetical protein